MELFFQFTHRCERNLRTTLRSPEGHVNFVMDRGLGRCSGVPTIFTSTNTELGEPRFFGGLEAGGNWTLTMADDINDGNFGTLDAWSLTITVKSGTPQP